MNDAELQDRYFYQLDPNVQMNEESIRHILFCPVWPTSLKLLDNSIKLRLIADNALDTEAISDNDSDRAKTPGGDLDDDGDKSVARDGSAISNKSFSATRKCHHSSSHGSSVINNTLWDDAPAWNDSQVVMPEFFDDPLVKCQRLSLQPKTKLIANRELSTCFEEAKACKKHYAQMAIPDCNVAIAPAIDDDLCLFLEWANKWPVRKDERLCNVNQALLECAFPLIAILKEIEKGNGDLSYVQKAVRHTLCHLSSALHDVTVNRRFETLRILGINTKILPEILSVNVASHENVQRCLDPSTKIAPPPLFRHLLCSKLKGRGRKDKTLGMALQTLGGPSNHLSGPPKWFITPPDDQKDFRPRSDTFKPKMYVTQTVLSVCLPNNKWKHFNNKGTLENESESVNIRAIWLKLCGFYARCFAYRQQRTALKNFTHLKAMKKL
uniref:Uncharacterized protein n=1 Tax=Romanomermis culicivorax TaxID=13658 RepID=A0A915JPL4_ROMCU